MKRAQHLQASLNREEKVTINLRLFLCNKIATYYCIVGLGDSTMVIHCHDSCDRWSIIMTNYHDDDSAFLLS